MGGSGKGVTIFSGMQVVHEESPFQVPEARLFSSHGREPVECNRAERPFSFFTGAPVGAIEPAQAPLPGLENNNRRRRRGATVSTGSRPWLENNPPLSGLTRITGSAKIRSHTPGEARLQYR